MSGAINGGAGEGILLSLIYPTAPEDLTVAQAEAFSEAVALQDSFSLGERAVKRESAGDVSREYYGGESGRVFVSGAEVSPLALAKLMECGLLSRWI